MHISDVDYAPNPNRAIWIEGQLNEALLERLRPRILELAARNRDPIRLFINSRGGSAEVAESILSLLKSSDNGEAPRRIITVAMPNAASAAADLLSAGDFAVALPESVLLYHGAGYLDLSDIPRLTEEVADALRFVTAHHNERKAAALRRVYERRFMFVFSGLRHEFERYRVESNGRTLTDLECFEAVLHGKLSPNGQRVLERAVSHRRRCDRLLFHFRKQSPTRGKAETLEERWLRASKAFEDETPLTDKSCSLRAGGLARIFDNFSLLASYFTSILRNRFENISGADLRDFLTADSATTRAAKREARGRVDSFLPFSTFFVGMCRALNQDENQLTALDAVLLGLVDTVRDQQSLVDLWSAELLAAR
jgi:ATP-dependent protease ClpP protease subunit